MDAALRTTVSLGAASYDVLVGRHLLDAVPAALERLLPAASCFVVVTDSNVAPLYAARLTAGFTRPTHVLTIPAGEPSKSRAQHARLQDEMSALGCHRDCCVVALGGGVVGDLAGYTAASYMRGVAFAQVPTTLLAAVDSSLGGKTGIDTPAGKNLEGAFHQPKAVFVDLELLRSLPVREIANGLAEVVKAGAILSAALFERLEREADGLLSADCAALDEVVHAAVGIKARVVGEDEREAGTRALLNFGHSVGHAVEALLMPRMLHGECVAVGMVKEAEIARALGLCSSGVVGRLVRLLRALRLPTRVPAEALPVGRILECMAVDKKNAGGAKRLVMLEAVGRARVEPACTTAVADAVIRQIVSPRACPLPAPRPLDAALRVPGSKSISNRALLMAALGRGDCRLTGLLQSDDTQVMMGALAAMGVEMAWSDAGDALVVRGAGGRLAAPREELYLSNAGTATRFLTAATTLLADGAAVLTGNARMKERPIGPLVDALRGAGCRVDCLESEGFLPLRVHGGAPMGGRVELEARVSSQYVSAVLLAAPYSAAGVELVLKEEHPTSLPYIRMTLQLMESFGVSVTTHADNHYSIPPGAYSNPATFNVEADASSATYPLAMAAITGGRVTVRGVGRDSCQGDAGFARLLESMGCSVEQTGDETTLTGPRDGQRLRAFEADMADLTDAFMTAAALAAVAEGTTRITGIANQRVKECDRIHAMAVELAKVGVRCRELEDGIEIEGAGAAEWAPSAAIECYNDHRIAMSFAVLAARVPGITVLDKECTDKTYPAFWHDCEQELGLPFAPPADSPSPSPSSTATIVVVGMRGAGKTSCGRAGARALSWDFVDADEELEREFGRPIADFVAEHGWPAFRAAEAASLARLLCERPEGAVLACGGGVVETAASVRLLDAYAGPVVQVRRPIDDIVAYLEQDASRPALGGDLRDTWARRAPLFDQVADYEFWAGGDDWAAVEARFARLVRRLAAAPPTTDAVAEEDHTFFVSLTCDVDELDVAAIAADADAVELRVDLLSSQARDHVSAQLARVHEAAPGKPVVFTARTQGQGGRAADADFGPLLALGRRLGCELLDVEAGWAGAAAFEPGPASRVIASFHVMDRRSSPAETARLFALCEAVRSAAVLKVVTRAEGAGDCTALHELAAERAAATGLPVIALAVGDQGRLSRVLNRRLTPVTHPLLPSAAAPGQLSAAELRALRLRLGLGGRCFIAGSPVAHSRSPALHNALLAATGLGRHRYGRLDTASVDVLLAQRPFLGVSVTMPLKVDVVPAMDELSPAAEAIGAVNTIVPLPDGRLRGDNTDWLGVRAPLSRLVREKAGAVVVLGAGGAAMGAAYAARQLGRELVVVNRTMAKAEALAQRFGGVALASADLPAEGVAAVVCTIPAGAQAVSPALRAMLGACRPGVLDASYHPLQTPVIAAAQEAGCEVAFGDEWLLEQGLAQFRLWFGPSVGDVDLAVVGREALFGSA